MFQIEVLVREGKVEEWKAMHTWEGRVYSYETREEAESMMRMCYGAPEHRERARVVEIENG